MIFTETSEIDFLVSYFDELDGQLFDMPMRLLLSISCYIDFLLYSITDDPWEYQGSFLEGRKNVSVNRNDLWRYHIIRGVYPDSFILIPYLLALSEYHLKILYLIAMLDYVVLKAEVYYPHGLHEPSESQEASLFQDLKSRIAQEELPDMWAGEMLQGLLIQLDIDRAKEFY